MLSCVYDVSDKIRTASLEINEEILFSDEKLNKIKKTTFLIGTDISSYFEIGEKSCFDFGKKINMPMLSVKKGDQEYSAANLLFGSVVYGILDYGWMYGRNSDFMLNGKYNFKKQRIDSFNFFGYHFNKDYKDELRDVLYWLGIEHSIPNLKKNLDILNKSGIKKIIECSHLAIGQSESFAKYYFAHKQNKNIWDGISEVQKQIVNIIKADSSKDGKYIKHKGGLMKELF